MNTQKVEGKFDQVAGKIKQSVGEAVGTHATSPQGVYRTPRRSWDA